MQGLLMLLALVPLALAVFGAVRAVRAWLAVVQMIRRPTTPLRDVREGPVEVEGWLRVVGEPLIAPSGARCAVLSVHMVRLERPAQGKARRHVREPLKLALAACELHDDTGGRLEVAPGTNVSIQGEAFLAEEVPVGAVPGEWQSLVVQQPATHVVLEEHRIEDGARVVVHGVAEQQPGDTTAYRGGMKAVLYPPGDDEPMLIWQGHEAYARRRALWLCVAMTACVGVLFDVALQVLLAAR